LIVAPPACRPASAECCIAAPSSPRSKPHPDRRDSEHAPAVPIPSTNSEAAILAAWSQASKYICMMQANKHGPHQVRLESALPSIFFTKFRGYFCQPTTSNVEKGSESCLDSHPSRT